MQWQCFKVGFGMDVIKFPPVKEILWLLSRNYKPEEIANILKLDLHKVVSIIERYCMKKGSK